MATITATERKRLGQVRPELWPLLLALMDSSESELGRKLYVSDFGGQRTSAIQARLYADSLDANGNQLYAVGKPETSRHVYGAAFDVHFVGEGTDDEYRQLADIGEELGMVAGYYFDHRGVGKHDPYHFQLNEPLQTSVDRWNAMQRLGIVKAAGAAVLIALAIGLTNR